MKRKNKKYLTDEEILKGEISVKEINELRKKIGLPYLENQNKNDKKIDLDSEILIEKYKIEEKLRKHRWKKFNNFFIKKIKQLFILLWFISFFYLLVIGICDLIN